jgi:hypothetical protein
MMIEVPRPSRRRCATVGGRGRASGAVEVDDLPRQAQLVLRRRTYAALARASPRASSNPHTALSVSIRAPNLSPGEPGSRA